MKVSKLFINNLSWDFSPFIRLLSCGVWFEKIRIGFQSIANIFRIPGQIVINNSIPMAISHLRPKISRK